MSTSSTSTAADISLFLAWETPRMLMNELPAFWVCTRVTFGVSAMKSWGVSMPAERISSSEKTLMEAGMSSTASSRLRAVVTTISSMIPDWSDTSATALVPGIHSSASAASPNSSLDILIPSFS